MSARASSPSPAVPTPTARDDRGVSDSHSGSLTDFVRLLPTLTARDGKGPGIKRERGQDLPAVIALLPTLTVGSERTDARRAERGYRPSTADVAVSLHSHQASGTDWGKYAPAIFRHELVTGRPVPDPTVTGRKGQPVLSPWFCEWMMDLPEGLTAGAPRTVRLRLLGNAVVPRQAALALELLDPEGQVTP